MEHIRNFEKLESIKHPNWSDMVLEKMWQMLQNDHLYDVFLTAADSTRIGAHKTILGASSAYFFSAFTDATGAAMQIPTELQLVDIDGPILQLLVKFSYTGNLDLSLDTIQNVIKGAVDLKFHAIIDLCCDFLVYNMNDENCCFIEMVADKFGLTELSMIAHFFILKNFKVISEGDALMTVSKEKLTSYLRSDDLVVPSEEDVFHALMKWTLHKSFKRLSFIPELLPLVRLTELSDSFLFDEVQNFAVGNNCSQLVIDALNWKFVHSRRDQMNPKFSTQPRSRKSKVDLMVMGGEGSDNNQDETIMEMYTLESNSWSDVKYKIKFPEGCAVVEMDGALIVLGGSKATHRDRGIPNVCRVTLSPGEAPTVEVLSNLLAARTDHDAAILSGFVYVVGGRMGPMTLTSLERYDSTTNTWHNLSPMSVGRCEMNLVALNDRLYVIGGGTSSKIVSESYDSVECYDPATDHWAPVPPMNKRRCQSAAAVANGRLYVFGGYDKKLSANSGAATDTVEFYDPDENTWTLVASLSSARYGFCAVPFLDGIIVVGGKDSNEQTGSIVEKYDAEMNTWSECHSMKHPRYCFNLCLV